MSYLSELYELAFTEGADPRVKNWPMMSGPIPMVFILLSYLYIVKIWGPNFMKNRPPFELKTIINYYNFFQVVANYFLFKGLLTSGWLTTISFGCELPDYSMNPEAMRMARWLWATVMLKFMELIETVFFILRKKNNQASLLHVYHHIITIVVMWMTVKYMAGGMASLTPLLNTFVHIIMYSYYLISSAADVDIRMKINKWKKWITILQMVQFTILFFHSLQGLLPSCPVPMFMVYVYIPNLMFIYYLFLNFFFKTYKSKNATK